MDAALRQAFRNRDNNHDELQTAAESRGTRSPFGTVRPWRRRRRGSSSRNGDTAAATRRRTPRSAADFPAAHAGRAFRNPCPACGRASSAFRPASACERERLGVFPLVAEQAVLEFLGKLWIAASNPLQQHSRMLFFLVSIVFEDCLEFRVFAYISTLVVPINGFNLFHQRNNGSMHVARFRGQLLYRLVITNTGHYFLRMKRVT